MPSQNAVGTFFNLLKKKGFTSFRGMGAVGEFRVAVEIHSTLNRRSTIYRRSRWSCSANFELLVRLTLNYPRFGSQNAELSTME